MQPAVSSNNKTKRYMIAPILVAVIQPQGKGNLVSRGWLFCFRSGGFHVERFEGIFNNDAMAERVGFEPTVELPRRRSWKNPKTLRDRSIKPLSHLSDYNHWSGFTRQASCPFHQQKTFEICRDVYAACQGTGKLIPVLEKLSSDCRPSS